MDRPYNLAMTDFEAWVKAWDVAQWELGEAFDGLPDEAVWVRAHPSLLSIGELAGHMAYWNAQMIVELTPKGEDGNEVALLESPLVNPAFRYFNDQVNHPVTLDLGAAETLSELNRIHGEAKAALVRVNEAGVDSVPGLSDQRWQFHLQYRGFHVAYHTGQAYSVRHLLGHVTNDN